MNKDKEFMLDLANLLERHKASIISYKIEANFTAIKFMSGGKGLFDTRRSSVTAYDLRCKSGMSTVQANEIYNIRKSIDTPAQRWYLLGESKHAYFWFRNPDNGETEILYKATNTKNSSEASEQYIDLSKLMAKHNTKAIEPCSGSESV